MLDSGVIKKIIYGFLTLFFCLLVFFICLEIWSEPQSITPVTYSVKEAHLCAFENKKWIKKDLFSIGEQIYLCVDISSSSPIDESHFQVYILNERNWSKKDPIFEDSIIFTESKKYIPIQYDLVPGKYSIEVLHIRQILIELPFEVIGEKSK